MLPHEQIIGKLDEAGKTFKVLLIKTPLTKQEEQAIADSAMYHVVHKTKYSFLMVGRFIPIIRFFFPEPGPFYLRKHVFCSELILKNAATAGRELVERCRAYQVPPRDPPRSPLLFFKETVVTT